ncbi:hypothetical protein C1X35_31150 [Pseudomonas sp. FW306-1C-G01A]|nr:hypothetical protein C1X56_31410 [Pseudomonas sp. GW101-1A09]PMV85993.1 hypothetical protein C1X51_29570 [Pseudomonas sp. FW306-2-2C-B10A]PMV90929.1 hypothetical protein C1X55_31935 [Pseudomonas sp. GW460-C8]PMV98065.1 hypothetical protein C1X50_31260 [Pseudomonas sp. MPR-TSA4]PMW08612.1 hypothetical protein C1X52_28915 [Pseudomonas sp. FW306-2-1A-C05A]PMW09910.1 hypothetical protein C1X40_32135 [Pseudomonas sp. GW456-11-11-14-TSB2]PMW11669.1 hypothetical protein C1X53_32035 [Pseudomonas s
MTKINVVLTAEQACEIVLGLFDGVMRDGKPERFVIQSCELSANGHYWPRVCKNAAPKLKCARLR